VAISGEGNKLRAEKFEEPWANVLDMAIIRDAAIHAALQCKGPLPPFVLDGHHLIPLYAKPTERNLFSGNTCITDSLAFCDDPLPSETSTTHITTLLYIAAFD